MLDWMVDEKILQIYYLPSKLTGCELLQIKQDNFVHFELCSNNFIYTDNNLQKIHIYHASHKKYCASIWLVTSLTACIK